MVEGELPAGCGATAAEGAGAPRAARPDSEAGRIAPDWLWDSPELVTALARLDLGTALGILQRRIGLTDLDLATVLGWDRRALSRVKAGRSRVLHHVDELRRVLDALDVPRTLLAPVLWEQSVAFTALRELQEVNEMALSRRDLASLAGLAGVSGLTTALGLDHVQVPAQVDMAHVRYFRAAVDTLSTQDQLVGGGALVRDGLRLYHRARRMLDESRYTRVVADHLTGLAAELADQAAWLCFDSNDQLTSRWLSVQARQLADQAGNDELAVRILQQMAHQHTHLAATHDNPALARQALQLVGRASDLARAGRHPAQLHALLACRHARAHAVLGDTQGFETHITQAWRELDRAGPPDELPLWLRFVTHGEVVSNEGSGRRELGDAEPAVRLHRARLDTDLSPRNRASGSALLAGALVEVGDLHGAFDEATRLLPTLGRAPGKINSPLINARLVAVREAAERHRAGTQFREAYDQMTTQDQLRLA